MAVEDVIQKRISWKRNNNGNTCVQSLQSNVRNRIRWTFSNNKWTVVQTQKNSKAAYDEWK